MTGLDSVNQRFSAQNSGREATQKSTDLFSAFFFSGQFSVSQRARERLAFTGQAELINTSKIAILLASVTAGSIGFLWLLLLGGNANLSSKQRDPAP